MLSSLFTSMVKDLARGTADDEEEPQGAILSLLGWLEKAALEPQAAHQKLLLDLALLLSCLVSRRSELLRWDPCGSSCLGRVGMAQGFEAKWEKAFTMGSIDPDCFRQCFYREYQQLVAMEEERGRELAWKGLAGAAAGAALGGLGGLYLGEVGDKVFRRHTDDAMNFLGGAQYGARYGGSIGSAGGQEAQRNKMELAMQMCQIQCRKQAAAAPCTAAGVS